MPPLPGRLPKLPVPGRLMLPPPIGRFIPPIAGRFIGLDGCAIPPGRVMPPAGRAIPPPVRPPPPIRPPPPRPRWAWATPALPRKIRIAANAIVDECLNMGYPAESVVWCQEADRAVTQSIPLPRIKSSETLRAPGSVMQETGHGAPDGNVWCSELICWMRRCRVARVRSLVETLHRVAEEVGEP
jgi:hypothetical protein